jgi:hypothetical protein
MAYSWNSTEAPEVRYAILGNGFDLECGLQTSYSSFLSFVKNGEFNKMGAGAGATSPVDWEGFRKNNFWYERFNSIQIGSGWVDFENEIARVVTNVEHSMLREDGTVAFMADEVEWTTQNSSKHVLNDIAWSWYDTEVDIQTYRDLVKKLIDDLNELTRYFEAYLFNHVTTTAPRSTAATKRLVNDLSACDVARVISFNYTSTLEQMLKKDGVNADFCYVHGAVTDGSGKNGMVLGINERSDAKESERLAAFGPFKKYNQRIFKQADSRYMTWLQDDRMPYEEANTLRKIEDSFALSSGNGVDLRETLNRIAKMKSGVEKKKNRKEVIIFGHSLGITDKDILKAFVTLPDARTVVYYHNEESFSSQVSNMTAILGVDEVIARTGGRERTLEFRNQNDLS